MLSQDGIQGSPESSLSSEQVEIQDLTNDFRLNLNLSQRDEYDWQDDPTRDSNVSFSSDILLKK